MSNSPGDSREQSVTSPTVEGGGATGRGFRTPERNTVACAPGLRRAKLRRDTDGVSPVPWVTGEIIGTFRDLICGGAEGWQTVHYALLCRALVEQVS